MKQTAYRALFVLLLLAPILRAAPDSAEQDWTHYVRIGAYGLEAETPTKLCASAQEDGVFGIEVDNDIPGRYESFLNPEEKLKAIRRPSGEGPCRRQPRVRVHRGNGVHHRKCR